jgi:hypothetical protein
MTETNSTQMPNAPAPAPSAISKATDVALSFMEKMSGGRKRRHTKSKRSKSKRSKSKRSMKGCSSKRRKRHSSHHKKRR